MPPGMLNWTPADFIFAVTTTIVLSGVLTVTMTSMYYTISDWLNRILQAVY